MCKVLQVSRSTYYYESKANKDESQLVTDIVEIFRRSRNNYGTRKIKHELNKMGQQVSRRRIGRIMKQEAWYQTIQSLNLIHIQQNLTKIRLKIS